MILFILNVALQRTSALTLWCQATFTTVGGATFLYSQLAVQDTTVATPVGDGVSALRYPLLPLKNQRTTIVKSSVGAGPRA